MRKIIAALVTSAALTVSGAVVTATPADAKVMQVVKAKPSKVAKWGKDAHTPKRVEFFRVNKHGIPNRLSLELWSGAEYVVTRCKREGERNCFYLAAKPSKGEDAMYVASVKGRTFIL